MRAIIAPADRSEFELREVPMPELGPGDVLVRVAAAAINPADPWIAGGAGRTAHGLAGDVGLGYDLAGTVEAVGDEVSGVRVGDRVAALHGDVRAATRAQAEFAAIPAADAARVPDALATAEAASVPLNALTASQALDLLGSPDEHRGARDRATLLVTGAAGGVGGYGIALAARRGWQVTGIARESDRAFVESQGATLATELPGDASFDAAFDAAALRDDVTPSIRDGGAFVGVQPPMPITPVRGISARDVAIRPDGETLAELLELHARGDLPARVAGTVPAERASEGYEALVGGGQRGRWLIAFE